jgi:glycerophosphoryl diester phosphodiesterase
VDEAHRMNLAVHVWVVDDEQEMRRLLSWGVDGIQTDRLDVLSSVLSDVADRPPPPLQQGLVR